MRIIHIIFVASLGYVDPDRVMGTENVYLSGWWLVSVCNIRPTDCMHLVTGSEVLALTIKRCHRMGSHVTRAGWLQGWGGGGVWILGRQEEL